MNLEKQQPDEERRRESKRRFVERFPLLTGLRVPAAHKVSLPRQFLGREVPDPGVLIRAYRNELKPRTRNALQQSEPGRTGEPWTFGRLLGIRGFGIQSLLDLLEVLVRHGARTSKQEGAQGLTEEVAPGTT